MYCLTDFCCVCFNKKVKLINTLQTNHHGTTTMNRLINDIFPNMNFHGLNNTLLICDKCTEHFIDIYKFKTICLKKNQTFGRYVRKLNTNGNKLGRLTVQCVDYTETTRDRNYVVLKTENDLFQIENDLERLENDSDDMNRNSVTLLYESEENMEFVEPSEDDYLVRKGSPIDNNSGVRVKTLNRTDIFEDDTVPNFLQFALNDIEKTENDIKDFKTSESYTIPNAIKIEDDDSTSRIPTKNIVLSQQTNIPPIATRINNGLYLIIPEPVRLIQPVKQSFGNASDLFQAVDPLSIETNTVDTKIEIHDDFSETYNSGDVNDEDESNDSVTNTIEEDDDEKSEENDNATHLSTDSGILSGYDILKSYGMDILKTCNICKMKFNTTRRLGLHYKEKHPDKKRLTCQICSKTFKCRMYLRNHLLKHFGVKIYKCTICSKLFQTADYLKRHVSWHSEERSYKCGLCKNMYKTERQLRKHSLVHGSSGSSCGTSSSEGSYPCKYCSKTFRDVKSFITHEKNDHTHAFKTYKCTSCDKEFDTLVKLYDHKQIHLYTKPYKCEDCHGLFQTLKQFKLHAIIHPLPYKCETCNEIFKTKDDIRHHLLYHPKYNCQFCSLQFRTLSQLQLHDIKQHSNNEPMKCDFCTKSFASLRYLKLHLKTHCPKTIYKCVVCTKTFNCSPVFRRHVFIHSTEKPYHCSNCAECFKDEKNLQIHYSYAHQILEVNEMRPRKMNNPYECSLCDTTYINRLNLKIHLCYVHNMMDKDIVTEITNIH